MAGPSGLLESATARFGSVVRPGPEAAPPLSHSRGATGHIDEAAAVRATFAIAPRTADGFKKSDDTQRRHGMNSHVSAILLGVADMGRSKRFYTEGLGWKVQ